MKTEEQKDLEQEVLDAQEVLDQAIWDLANVSKNVSDAYQKYLAEKKALKEFIADKNDLAEEPY